MYTGFYETDLDKMALCTESMKLAKVNVTKEDGIGSDLNINIFGWRKNELLIIIQLKNTYNLPKESRIKSIIEASCILRKGWDVDEFTLIAEGYCSMKPSETKGLELANVFAQKDSPVTECLSFVHLRDEELLFLAIPYKTNLGRVVEFGSVLWYPGGHVMRDIEYPAALKAILRLDKEPLNTTQDKETYFATLASGIMEQGFEVFYRDDI